jgi:hypothetical protein
MGTEHYAIIETRTAPHSPWSFMSLWSLGKTYELASEIYERLPANGPYEPWPSDVCEISADYTYDWHYRTVLTPEQLPLDYGQHGSAYGALVAAVESAGDCRILFCKD